MTNTILQSAQPKPGHAFLERLLLNPEVREAWNSGSDTGLLSAYERVWDRKAVLRTFYERWYSEIFDALKPGNIIEIGAGTGNFKRWLPERNRRCCTLDILPGKYVDMQADALRLPFRAGTLDNIVMIDTIHHLAQPFRFLHHAKDLLRPGGRVIMLEPFVSLWGRFVYRFLHHERYDFSFVETDAPKKAAWEGNPAVPRIVLAPENRHRIPLEVKTITYSECLAYLISGGFSYRALLPSPLLRGLHRLEQNPLFENRVLSIRVFAVLEKPA